MERVAAREVIVYISGAITDNPGYKLEFSDMELSLSILGYTVLNPAILPHGLEYEAYMAIDFAMIDACDIICMMPGWEKSAGARREYEYATNKGKTVWILHSGSTLELLEYATCTKGQDEESASGAGMATGLVLNIMMQAVIDGKDRLGRTPDALVLGREAYKDLTACVGNDVLMRMNGRDAQKETAWGIPLIVAGDGFFVGYMEITYAAGAAT